MQPAPQHPSRSGLYRADLCHSGGSIRLHCPAQLIGAPLQIDVQLTTPQRATPFPSREAGEILAARYFPHLAVEIVRVDA